MFNNMKFCLLKTEIDDQQHEILLKENRNWFSTWNSAIKKLKFLYVVLFIKYRICMRMCYKIIFMNHVDTSQSLETDCISDAGRLNPGENGA